MERQNYDKPDDNPYNIFYDNYLDTNACTECTGLMYKTARDRKDWDSYREVFDFTPKDTTPKVGSNTPDE